MNIHQSNQSYFQPPRQIKPAPAPKPIAPPPAPASISLSDAACNTDRGGVRPPPKRQVDSNTQTPRKRIQDRPTTAPEKRKRPPNPLLGEGGYSGGGGHHGGGMGPLRPPSAGIPNYNTFDDKHLIGMSLSCNRIVVSTSRCGRDNPGSNPGYSIFYTTDEYTQF